jgi:hypothetical protein
LLTEFDVTHFDKMLKEVESGNFSILFKKERKFSPSAKIEQWAKVGPNKVGPSWTNSSLQ